MLKRLSKLSIEKLELLLASALGFAILASVKDLPYTVPCVFFFGEPEYPSNES